MREAMMQVVLIRIVIVIFVELISALPVTRVLSVLLVLLMRKAMMQVVLIQIVIM